MPAIMEAQAHFDQIAEVLKHSSPGVVNVEYGHFYVEAAKQEQTELGSAEQLLGIRIGQELTNYLLSQGLPVQTMLFVDDLHGVEGETYESVQSRRDEALSQVKDLGFSPDVIVSEAEMTPAAAHLYGLLRLKGIVARGSRNLPKHWGSAPLITEFEDGSIQPSCSLIDAALSLKSLGPDQVNAKVTVIHEKYRSQQEQVKKILQAFGIISPLLAVVYYSDDREVTGSDTWTS